MGTWVTLTDVAITELAGNAGLHWVAVDLEHSTLSDHHFEQHARVASLSGITCLARIPAVDHHRIKRLMDAGADGIIVANVQSRSDLDAAVAAMRYPPHGSRGVGLGRSHLYGPGFQPYVDTHHEAVLVAQIEHVDALPSLASILSHPALTAWMIGPYDLSASLGYPGDFSHPDVIAAVHRIRTEAKNHAAAAGIHVVEPNVAELETRLQEGYRFVAYSVDFRALDVAMRDGVQALQTFSTGPNSPLATKDT